MERDDAPAVASAPAFEARLHADGVEFDRRDVQLLRAIEEAGSLNAATETLGRSYSRAHQRVAALEEAFGPLVERTRGGSGGGGSTLTEDAWALLARFDRFEAELSGVAATEETVYEGKVLDREGELATVRAPVGDLRVFAPHEADEVQVTLRADAVTLIDPSDTPDAGGTSARNRLEGTVVGLDPGTSVALVRIDIGGPAPLTALVTTDSVSRLGLAPGERVVATFKATATRATPR